VRIAGQEAGAKKDDLGGRKAKELTAELCGWIMPLSLVLILMDRLKRERGASRMTKPRLPPQL
jgi:hypothetical protein